MINSRFPSVSNSNFFIDNSKENNLNPIARPGLLAPIEHVPKIQGVDDSKDDQPKPLIRIGELQPLSQRLPSIQEVSSSRVGLVPPLVPLIPKMQKFEDLKGAGLKEAIRIWLLQPTSKIQEWGDLKEGRVKQIETSLASKPRARASSLSIEVSKYMPSMHKDTFISSRKDFTCLLVEESSNRLGYMIRPCKRAHGSSYNVAVTHSKAVKFLQQPAKPALQKRGENIADKIRLGNEEIGLKTHKATLLDSKKFGILDCKGGRFCKMGQFGGLVEEAFLGDCEEIKISGKKELFSLFACVIHQVDVLHKANIAHMDIKEKNICNDKKGLFRIIDMDSSIDFNDNALEDIRDVKFGFTPARVSPKMVHNLRKANTWEEAQEIAKRIDIFTMGTVFYQMTHAVKVGKPVKECKNLPFVSEKQEFIKIVNGEVLSKRRFEAPFIPKMKDELDETLSIIENQTQRRLIERMISFNFEGQPTTAELKGAFPSSLIVKK